MSNEKMFATTSKGSNISLWYTWIFVYLRDVLILFGTENPHSYRQQKIDKRRPRCLFLFSIPISSRPNILFVDIGQDKFLQILNFKKNIFYISFITQNAARFKNVKRFWHAVLDIKHRLRLYQVRLLNYYSIPISYSWKYKTFKEIISYLNTVSADK